MYSTTNSPRDINEKREECLLTVQGKKNREGNDRTDDDCSIRARDQAKKECVSTKEDIVI